MAHALVACGSGGAGTFGDGGAPAQISPEDEAGAKDAGSKGTSLDAATSPDATTSYPDSCAGLCAKAAAAVDCDPTTCTDACEAKAQAATAECDVEWGAYLHCAVAGGKISACSFNGKLTLTRCEDEARALEICLNNPKQCTPSCKTHMECETSCPKAPSGTNTCCDFASGFASGVCFRVMQAACPGSG